MVYKASRTPIIYGGLYVAPSIPVAASMSTGKPERVKNSELSPKNNIAQRVPDPFLRERAESEIETIRLRSTYMYWEIIIPAEMHMAAT